MTNIIAEIGLNHLGNYDLAQEYVDTLNLTSVEGITFQIREPEFYLRPEKVHLQLVPSQYEILSKRIKNSGKSFGVAIADINQIDFFETLDTDFYKVIRNDITNKELIAKLIATGKKIIISTGLSSDDDINNFIKEFDTSNVVLNHTQLSYDESDCNLRAIEGMRQRYNLPISFGSHCKNINVLYMSLCYNPTDILFYVRKDNRLYPDHKHAVTLENVHSVVSNINNLTSAPGIEYKLDLGNKIPEMNI